MSHIALRATAHHQSCLPHIMFWGGVVESARPRFIRSGQRCSLHPKKDYNCSFLHLEHLPLSVTSESRVHYSRPRPSASGWVNGGPSCCRTVKHPSEGPTWLNLWRHSSAIPNRILLLCPSPPPEAQRSFGFRSPPMRPIRQRSNWGNGNTFVNVGTLMSRMWQWIILCTLTATDNMIAPFDACGVIPIHRYIIILW